eukprot:2005347-Pyramimonas_sp.AAC.1
MRTASWTWDWTTPVSWRSGRPASLQRRSCGVGSSWLDGRTVQYVTWNARALCHHDAPAVSRRLRVLTTLASPQAIVSLQETHGSRDAVADA